MFTALLVVYTDPPGPPRLFTISDINSTSFNVSWELPSSNSTFSEVNGFDANCTTSQSDFLWSVSFLGNSSLSTLVTGLEEYTLYTCCVLARNSGGSGAGVCRNVMTDQAGIYIYMWHMYYIAIKYGP